jgi:hypothetical protein
VPDVPVEPTSPGRYPSDMESRVAVLEQIARSTTAALERIERGLDIQRADYRGLQERLERGMDVQRAESRALEERLGRRLDIQQAESRSVQERLERRIDVLAADQRSEFRWLLGIMLAGFGTLLGALGAMLGVMAHGFHWL